MNVAETLNVAEALNEAIMFANVGLTANEKTLAGWKAARRKAQALEECAASLELILPLAKGYVAHNNVGNNRQFISDAEAALLKLQESDK